MWRALRPPGLMLAGALAGVLVAGAATPEDAAKPWFLVTAVEGTCVPPSEVFAGARSPEDVARALSGGENRYAVRYDGRGAAASRTARLQDTKGHGGIVTLVRGREACLQTVKAMPAE